MFIQIFMSRDHHEERLLTALMFSTVCKGRGVIFPSSLVKKKNVGFADSGLDPIRLLSPNHRCASFAASLLGITSWCRPLSYLNVSWPLSLIGTFVMAFVGFCICPAGF